MLTCNLRYRHILNSKTTHLESIRNQKYLKKSGLTICVSAVASAILLGASTAASAQTRENSRIYEKRDIAAHTHQPPKEENGISSQSMQYQNGEVPSLFTPPSPKVMRLATTGGIEHWEEVKNLTAGRTPVHSTYDCAIDFNDENALNLFVNKAADTFAHFPFWNQVCNVDVSVAVRPFYINHFHLTYEKDVCIDSSTSSFGEMQEDESCLAFPDPAKEARQLSSMISTDVIELTAYNNYYNTRINFDLKRLRVVGSRPVRVCYKPAEQDNEGDWITLEADSATDTGIWLCWNSLPTGYWDLSTWAGDVSAVRLIAAEGHPNFAVDDILINAPPY